MENSQKLIIGVIVSLIIGIFIGTALQGDKKEKKPEIKKVLQSTVEEIENLERENKELKAFAAKSKEKTESDKKLLNERNALQKQLSILQSDNKKLQSMISQLRSDKSGETALKELSENYERTLFSLEKANKNLIAQLESAQEEITKANLETTQLRSDAARAHEQLNKETTKREVIEQLKRRIIKLEKDNQELTSIVDSINTMLKGRETVPGQGM